MKKTYFLLIALLILAGCGVTEQLSQGKNGLVVIDVDKNYQSGPNILIVADSMEFIPLETTDDFLCADGKIIAFTDELIIYSNEDWAGSDILIFDAKGRALKKVSRRGQSGEEYTYKKEVVYDDKSRELFVNDAVLSKIFVYDLEGNFKRNFRYLEGIEIFKLTIGNFDEESLLCYDSSEKAEHPWFLISKQTGEKIQDILIPFKEKVSRVVSSKKHTGGNITGSSNVIVPIKFAIENGDSWILNEPSSDTIFSMGKDRILKPLLVRTPTVSKMTPQILLAVEAKIGDFLYLSNYVPSLGQSPVGLLYSYKENMVFHSPSNLSFSFYNLKNAKSFSTIQLSVCKFHNTRKNIIAFCYNADYLLKIYNQDDNKEEFSEKYKTAVSQIEEDSNPVLVKIKLAK
jgi:hypothetical protein